MSPQQEARLAFELEMAEYYEAAGLDRYAERSRGIAAELAEAESYGDTGPYPVPALEAEPEAELEP
jgi:hypothetical protein